MISLCLMGIFLFVTFLQNVHMFVYICVCVCLHVCWVFTAAQDFLQLWWAGSTLRCDLRASHCSGFSCCGAWALGTQASVVTSHWLSCCNFQAPELGSVVVVHGLIASQHVGSSWTRNRSNLHLLQWHADSHPLCQQGSPLCVHIFNVPNCISFSCLPLALNKVATGLHRYSLYSLSICAPRERHRLMTFAHWIMLQNPHACSLRDWSDISSSFIPRNGTAAPWGLWFFFFLNRTKY